MSVIGKSVNLAVIIISLGLNSLASAETIREDPGAGAMVADAIFARPLYFVLSQAGALIYTATLPFTLLGGNADEAAETFVVTPLQAAFVRCLGCGKIPDEVGELREGEGKNIHHFIMLNGGASFLDTESKKTTGAGYGIYAGTHFELADKSRFDVMLGAKRLGNIEFKKPVGTYKDDMMSYQIVTRFGKEIFASTDLMFKLGMHSWSTDRDFPGGESGSTSGVDFLWGLGLDTGLSESIRLGAEYTAYSLENSDDDYEADINTLDLNLSFMF